jgi:hypothetical protein
LVRYRIVNEGGPRLGYSYLRVGYYCGRLSDSLTGPAKEHERAQTSTYNPNQSSTNRRWARINAQRLEEGNSHKILSCHRLGRGPKTQGTQRKRRKKNSRKKAQKAQKKMAKNTRGENADLHLERAAEAVMIQIQAIAGSANGSEQRAFLCFLRLLAAIFLSSFSLRTLRFCAAIPVPSKSFGLRLLELVELLNSFPPCITVSRPLRMRRYWGSSTGN